MTTKLFFSFVLFMVAILMIVINWDLYGYGKAILVAAMIIIGVVLLILDLGERNRHDNLVSAENVKSKKIVPSFLRVKVRTK